MRDLCDYAGFAKYAENRIKPASLIVCTHAMCNLVYYVYEVFGQISQCYETE